MEPQARLKLLIIILLRLPQCGIRGVSRHTCLLLPPPLLVLLFDCFETALNYVTETYDLRGPWTEATLLPSCAQDVHDLTHVTTALQGTGLPGPLPSLTGLLASPTTGPEEPCAKFAI